MTAAPWRSNAARASLLPAPMPPVMATAIGLAKLLGLVGGSLCLGGRLRLFGGGLFGRRLFRGGLFGGRLLGGQLFDRRLFRRPGHPLPQHRPEGRPRPPPPPAGPPRGPGPL